MALDYGYVPFELVLGVSSGSYLHCFLTVKFLTGCSLHQTRCQVVLNDISDGDAIKGSNLHLKYLDSDGLDFGTRDLS